MSGEQAHLKGADGAYRAKVWLEATTRAQVHWVNPHGVAPVKLTFSWANKNRDPFSYDLGGVLIGDALDGMQFVVESKFYDKDRDQGTHFRSFLAKSYCALKFERPRCDQFMFITWAPFLVSKWDELTSPSFIAEAVTAHGDSTLRAGDNEPKDALDQGVCTDLSDRLWIIVLSEKQETNLVLSRDDRALVLGERIKRGAA